MPGGQPGRAGEVEGLLADLADAAADDLADLGRVDPGALDHRLLGGGRAGRPGGWWRTRRPDAPRGADGFDDDDLRHGRQPIYSCSRTDNSGGYRRRRLPSPSASRMSSRPAEPTKAMNDRPEVEVVERLGGRPLDEPPQGSTDQGAHDPDGHRREHPRLGAPTALGRARREQADDAPRHDPHAGDRSGRGGAGPRPGRRGPTGGRGGVGRGLGGECRPELGPRRPRCPCRPVALVASSSRQERGSR